MLKDGGQHYEDLTRFTVFCTDHEDFIFDANLERVRCQTGKDAPEDREQGSVSLQRYTIDAFSWPAFCIEDFGWGSRG